MSTGIAKCIVRTKYDSIDAGDRYQVKRITAAGRLPVTDDHHRADTAVVAGTKVTIDDIKRLVKRVHLYSAATYRPENPENSNI